MDERAKAQRDAAAARAAAARQELELYRANCREVFDSEPGRRLLARLRHEFFDQQTYSTREQADGMKSALNAAYRDGQRSVIARILSLIEEDDGRAGHRNG